MSETKALRYDEHSPRFQEMVSRLDRYGGLDRPDGYGCRQRGCGDTIEFFLMVRFGRIDLITFRVNGCAHTVACGNTVTVLVEGKSLDEAWQLEPEEVADYLESLPADHHHCAELAVGGLYDALTDYNRREREAWKKPYPLRP